MVYSVRLDDERIPNAALGPGWHIKVSGPFGGRCLYLSITLTGANFNWRN